MNCPLCHKEVIIKDKQVGTDENGQPIINRYAICYDCKKQWNLDKKKIKKKESSESAEDKKTSVPAQLEKETFSEQAKKEAVPEPVKRDTVSSSEKAGAKSAPEKDEETLSAQKTKAIQRRNRRNRPAEAGTAPSERRRRPAGEDVERPARQGSRPSGSRPKKYGNIPPAHVRQTSELNVKQAYEDMLSTSSLSKKGMKKAAAADMEKRVRSKDERVQQKRRETQDRLREKSRAAEKEEVFDDEEEEAPIIYMRIPRVLVGLISLLGFAFFTYEAFITGLNSSGDSSFSGNGMTFIIMAICCLLSSIILLGLQKKNTIFAFLLPIAFFGAAGGYAFLKRGSAALLTYGAIGMAVLALVMLVFLIVYLTSGEEEYDDYDDDEFNEY